jgi:hypothetical protein
MTEKKRKKLRKWIFPAGIFILLFLTETIIGSGAALTYLYLDGKKGIERIEKYTVNYSMTMAEAFARVAELSYKTKNYSSLKTLFHEKIEENTIDEAFFILGDGKLIVHSNTTTEKNLMGNIANDEMSYNLDMILQPVTKRSSELFLSDYNIIDKQVPFSRKEREPLQKYYYSGINSSGWLFTKGVFVNGKPVGAVNFIISKERMFGSIKESIARGRLMITAVILSAFCVSLLISVIVMFRYRTIQRRAGEFASPEAPAEIKLPAAGRAVSTPLHTDEVIPASEVYFADDDLDGIPDEPFDETIIEEEPELFTLSSIDEEPLPELRSHVAADNEEYVTIELLGEIDEEIQAKPELDLQEGGRVYIAPVISIDAIRKAKRKEIRDAIPVHGRG